MHIQILYGNEEISLARSLEEMSVRTNVWRTHEHKPRTSQETVRLIEIFACRSISKCTHDTHVLLSASLWSEMSLRYVHLQSLTQLEDQSRLIFCCH